jgi:hypothetical protein
VNYVTIWNLGSYFVVDFLPLKIEKTVYRFTNSVSLDVIEF